MDNKTNTPNNTSPTPVKKPIQLYLTAALIVLTIISIILSSVCIGVVINKDTNKRNLTDKSTIYINFDYVITPQFTQAASFNRGDFLIKPENPTYTDNIFNTGSYISSNGNNDDTEMNISNPRFNPSYNPDMNYMFIGWYTSPTFELYTLWDFNEDRIYRDMILYAKWIEKA